MPKKRDEAAVEIIYQDEDVLIVNKPSGISVTHDRSGAEDLPTLLSKELGLTEGQELRLVHRLDKDTSGVLVIAKNLPAQSWLSSCFEKGVAKKTYLAIVRGAAVGGRGKIAARIAEMPYERNKMHVARVGKEAVTEWELLADFGLLSLLAVYPQTGRTHQIRVHLPSVGLPLAIDPVYGSKDGICLSEIKPGYRIARGQEEKPLMERLTLHAYQLAVPLKEGAEPSVFVAALDEKFKATVKMLAKHNRNGLGSFARLGVFDRIVKGEPIDRGPEPVESAQDEESPEDEASTQ
jgi:23S rRNA pseudouridine1911/1915/1917 synthase